MSRQRRFTCYTAEDEVPADFLGNAALRQNRKWSFLLLVVVVNIFMNTNPTFPANTKVIPELEHPYANKKNKKQTSANVAQSVDESRQ